MTLKLDLTAFDVPFDWYIYQLPGGATTTQSDFSNLAELLQSCADLTRIKLPTKFQDQFEQKSITYPERKSIEGPKNVLECLDVIEYLVLKDKDASIRPSEIRGGPIDALIVFATQSNGSLLYQEAFLSTYRTFIPTQSLIQKLIHRYIYMWLSSEQLSQKSARLTFSVIVRIVDELCQIEINKELVSIITQFVYRLIRDGNFQFARLLRTRLIERIEGSANRPIPLFVDRLKKVDSLLDFRSQSIAEQLTLLDQNLFQSIESSEFLWWAEAQDEKKCPNLVIFTEQFNKMSYWVRTVVLSPKEHKDREKFMNKFVKIMKQLRRLGNFNGYLAILSALDSGPVRRLEWGKMATEQLKEHAVIMDSSGSFKAYRTALVETSPPCIPYVGLVLQDLTFVHVGNVNYLQSEIVNGRNDLLNFGKRWQQFAILDSIRKLKRWFVFGKLD